MDRDPAMIRAAVDAQKRAVAKLFDVLREGSLDTEGVTRDTYGRGEAFGHDVIEMDNACCAMDAMIAPFLPQWRAAGYEVIVTADHGQSLRGHHGGAGEDQQDFALYYFGDAKGPAPDTVLDQLQLAPTILSRMGVPVPPTMTAKPFLS